MIDFTTIEAGIKTWALAASELPTYWAPKPVGMETAGYVVLEMSGEIQGLGADWVTTETAPAPNELKLIPTVNGFRTGKFLIKVCSRSQEPAQTARYYCERMRSRLKQPVLLAILQAAGVAVTNVGGTKPYDVGARAPDERMLSIAAFEVGFSCVSIDVAPAGAEIGTIGSIEITSNLDAQADTTITVSEPDP